MHRRLASTAAIAALLFAAALPRAHAQHGGTAPLPATAPARESAQFDFLVGQWELEVTRKVGGLAAMIHETPKLVGSWKAWRAFDGFGIDDELRIVDASGNPLTLAHAQRVWDPKARQWLVGTLDVYRARLTSASAQWQDGEMRLTGSGTGADGKPYLTRTRFYEIGPERFRMRQDRSTDNGASWDEGALNIAAKRVAAKAAR